MVSGHATDEGRQTGTGRLTPRPEQEPLKTLIGILQLMHAQVGPTHVINDFLPNAFSVRRNQPLTMCCKKELVRFSWAAMAKICCPKWVWALTLT